MSESTQNNWRDLINRYLEGTIDQAEFAQLKTGLRTDATCRTLYFSAVRLDTLLRESACIADAKPVGTRLQFPRPMVWRAAATIAACVLITFGVLFGILGNQTAAKIGRDANAEWLSAIHQSGSSLQIGDVIELASGSVEINFNSGAYTQILGPCRFEITSANSGFLHYGEATSRADVPSANGFSIQTKGGQFIDQGTEFLTKVNHDGFSQMLVLSGAVDVEVAGRVRQRVEKGGGFGIESGANPVTIKIESGDETPAFKFPSIPPPTNLDYADASQQHSLIELLGKDAKGRIDRIHRNSGNANKLIDGLGQQDPHSAGESVFFPNDASGMILFDLGREIAIKKICTYSWHESRSEKSLAQRAVQRYTLWGALDPKPSVIPSEGNHNGWTRIARVDTDTFFNLERVTDRPAQQACMIQAQASIGQFRYLLFDVIPTQDRRNLPARHTYFGEIDVFSNN